MSPLDETGPIATTDQFKSALLAVRDWHGISPTQLRMLQAQCRAPQSTISAPQMAKALNFKSLAATRTQYGTLGRLIAGMLGYAPPASKGGTRFWWLTLSTSPAMMQGQSDPPPEWIMRPELVAALRAMKWA